MILIKAGVSPLRVPLRDFAKYIFKSIYIYIYIFIYYIMTAGEVPNSEGRNLPAFTYLHKAYPAGFYVNAEILEAFNKRDNIEKYQAPKKHEKLSLKSASKIVFGTVTGDEAILEAEIHGSGQDVLDSSISMSDAELGANIGVAIVTVGALKGSGIRGRSAARGRGGTGERGGYTRTGTEETSQLADNLDPTESQTSTGKATESIFDLPKWYQWKTPTKEEKAGYEKVTTDEIYDEMKKEGRELSDDETTRDAVENAVNDYNNLPFKDKLNLEMKNIQKNINELKEMDIKSPAQDDLLIEQEAIYKRQQTRLFEENNGLIKRSPLEYLQEYKSQFGKIPKETEYNEFVKNFNNYRVESKNITNADRLSFERNNKLTEYNNDYLETQDLYTEEINPQLSEFQQWKMWKDGPRNKSFSETLKENAENQRRTSRENVKIIEDRVKTRNKNISDFEKTKEQIEKDELQKEEQKNAFNGTYEDLLNKQIKGLKLNNTEKLLIDQGKIIFEKRQGQRILEEQTEIYNAGIERINNEITWQEIIAESDFATPPAIKALRKLGQTAYEADQDARLLELNENFNNAKNNYGDFEFNEYDLKAEQARTNRNNILKEIEQRPTFDELEENSRRGFAVDENLLLGESEYNLRNELDAERAISEFDREIEEINIDAEKSNNNFDQDYYYENSDEVRSGYKKLEQAEQAEPTETIADEEIIKTDEAIDEDEAINEDEAIKNRRRQIEDTEEIEDKANNPTEEPIHKKSTIGKPSDLITGTVGATLAQGTRADNTNNQTEATEEPTTAQENNNVDKNNIEKHSYFKIKQTSTVRNIDELFIKTLNLCEEVYFNIQKTNNYIKFENFEYPVSFKREYGVLYVTWRGTASTENFMTGLMSDDDTLESDIDNNFLFYDVFKAYTDLTKDTDIRIHKGYLGETAKTYQIIRDQIDKYNVSELVLSGHSAGAVLSSIFYFVYQHDITYNNTNHRKKKVTNCINWCSPRFVFNENENTEKYNKDCPNLIRVYNSIDIIPYIPFLESKIDFFGGYRHVGLGLCLDKINEKITIDQLVYNIIKNGETQLKNLVEHININTVDTNKFLKILATKEARELLINVSLECAKLDISEESLNNINGDVIAQYINNNIKLLNTWNDKCDFLKIYSLSDVFKKSKLGELPEFYENNIIQNIILSFLTGTGLSNLKNIEKAHGFEYNRELLKNLIRLEINTRESILNIKKDETEFSNKLTPINTYNPLPPIIAIYKGSYNNYDFVKWTL